MLAHSNAGAVAFLQKLAARSISHPATEKLIFGNCFVICFVFDCLAVHHDTLRYLGV